MPRFLVTGGAGFVGSHLVEALVARGESVRVVDDFSSGKRENLPQSSSSLEIVEADIRDLDAVRAVVDGCEVIFHEAGRPSVSRSIQDPLTSHEVNATGTLNLLVAGQDAGVRRLVYAGSSSAYGGSELLPKSEAHRESPLSPYAVSKLAGEHYCRVAAHLGQIETVILRYFNIFGPRQDASSPYSGVISLFATSLLRGEAPKILGDGDQTRDFTYIENVVSANLAAAERPVEPGVIINVGCGERTSINELCRVLQEIIGQEVEAEYGPARAGDPRDSLADITRLLNVLGVEPKIQLEEGLRRTVAWYKEQAALQLG
ncbi:MAG: SDR family oxidoreductase [Planctomycetota bacterium]